jgi:cysteine-rich repeat protein
MKVKMRTVKTTLIGFTSLLAVACDQPPAGTPPASGGASGAGGASAQGGAVHEARPLLSGVNRYLVPAPGTSSAPMAQAGGSSGGMAGQTPSGGSGGVVSAFNCVPTTILGVAPTTAVCGDGFLTSPEQCDDGNTLDGDACSASCLVTPTLVAPRAAASAPPGLPGRELQLGRHPLGVGCNTTGLAFLDRSSKPAALKLATYSRSGVSNGVVSFGSAEVDRPSPSLAALPDDTFIAAWTAFDSDELGVQLRRIDPTLPSSEAAITANEAQQFSQREPDVVFDGQQVIVAWTDDSDPSKGPDVHYRTFAPDLTPTSHDLTLAGTSAVEGNVALAAMNGAWAAAWRSGSNGSETVEVQSGGTHWSVGPFLPSESDDRPALVFLDASHLALALSEGSDPNETGTANVSKLHAAILDAAFPGNVESFSIPQTVAPWANVPGLSQTQPTLVAMVDRLVVGWRTSLVNGNASGDELWTRELKWAPGPSNTLVVDTSSPDIPMISAEARRDGDQSEPALLSSPTWPGHSLVSAWQDSGKTFGAASGQPDVALQFSQVQSTCTGATLVSNVPTTYDVTGQYAVLGQKLVWTATGACHGAVQYRFVMWTAAGGWKEVQDWSSSNTYTWDTAGLPLGFYALQVWVRDQPSGSYEAYTQRAILLNDAPACVSATLDTGRYPQYWVTGEVSHWTAHADCGGTPRYKFWVLEPGANS